MHGYFWRKYSQTVDTFVSNHTVGLLEQNLPGCLVYIDISSSRHEDFVFCSTRLTRLIVIPMARSAEHRAMSEQCCHE